jgi:hypothetical protein
MLYSTISTIAFVTLITVILHLSPLYRKVKSLSEKARKLNPEIYLSTNIIPIV